MEKQMYYSPNILIPTNRLDENGAKIPDTEGFIWYMNGANDDFESLLVTVRVRCAVNDKQAELRTRLVTFNYDADYVWTNEDCLNAVMNTPIFNNSKLVIEDNPNTQKDESGGIWSKVSAFIKNIFK